MILFLDFDGVLHPDPCYDEKKLFCKLPLLEATLSDFPRLDIVISSTWRLQFPLRELQQLFSEDIGRRIIDITPAILQFEPAPDLAPYPRHAEIEEWLKQSGRAEETWVALDDRPEWFKPFLENLVWCNSKTGLTEETAHQLILKLRGELGPVA